MHIKKMVIRIILDAFLIMAGVFIVTVFRALFPTHLPNIYTPKDIGLNYEEVTFPASDGTKLSGWLIYHTNAKATIICCHGYPANKSDIWESKIWKFLFLSGFIFCSCRSPSWQRIPSITCKVKLSPSASFSEKSRFSNSSRK